MRLGNPEDIFYVCSIFLYTLVSSLIISQAIVFDPEYDRNCVYQLLSRIPVSWDLLEMIQYDGKLWLTMTVIDMSLQLSFLFITYYLVERETYLAWVNQVGPTLAQRFKELFTAFWSGVKFHQPGVQILPECRMLRLHCRCRRTLVLEVLQRTSQPYNHSAWCVVP